jgi:hypothetical protein
MVIGAIVLFAVEMYLVKRSNKDITVETVDETENI